MSQQEWIFSASLRGGMGKIRKNNEDAYFMNGVYPSLRDLDKDVRLTQRVSMSGAMYAVCDGMGGQEHGEAAASSAVASMEEMRRRLSGRDFEEVVQSWSRRISSITTSGR